MVSLSKPDLTNLLGPEGPLDSYLEKCIAVLVAMGLSDSQISKILQVSEPRLESLKALPSIALTVLDIQVALSLSPEQRIANAINTALDKKMKLMLTSDDDKLVNSIADSFLDRQFGKATQMIQSTSVTISASTNQTELDRRLDAVKSRLALLDSQKNKLVNARPVIDVTPNANS
jgi:hypothetical protein